MSLDTKPNLSSDRFEQFSCDTLNLSGCTNIFGYFEIASGATISILANAGVGKVLTSDSVGTGTWQISSGGTGGTVTGAINGLSLAGTNVVLGGVLTGDTNVSACTSIFSITGAHVCMCFDNINDCFQLDTNGLGGGAWSFNRFGMTCNCTYIKVANCNRTSAFSITGDTLNINFTVGHIKDMSATSGLTYVDCYHNTYVNRSLVDKEYVDKNSGIGWSNSINGSTVAGCCTLFSAGTVCQNTLYGVEAGKCMGVAGCDNIGIGYQALYSNANNSKNIGIGTQALYNNVNGCNDIAIGYQALYSNDGGQLNIAIGNQALHDNCIGYCNIAIGYQALSANTTGAENVAIAYQALYSNISGGGNIAIGIQALYSNICGSGNIANGCRALYSNICGCNNIANGYAALSGNTIGCNNIANGSYALWHNTCGCDNIANGWQALTYNISGNSNISIGYKTLCCNTCGSLNIAIGCLALAANTIGNYNVANGANSLFSNISGNYNIANGYAALGLNLTGCHNIATGYNALIWNCLGCNNIAIGNQALNCNKAGNNNIGIGECAGYNETGSDKLYISNSGTAYPLIYGDFSTKCITIHGQLKITGVTDGTCSNSSLVWDSSTCLVKKVPYSSGGTGGGASFSEFTITGDSSSTGFTINHAKNKTFVGVEIVKNTSPYPTIYTSISRPNNNCVCITFDIAPANGQQYKILITS